MSRSFTRTTLLLVLLLGATPAARSEGPPIMAGSAPTAVALPPVVVDPNPPIAAPFVPPTHVTPRLPILLTTLRSSGGDVLQPPFLLDPADVRRNRRVTSSLRVYSTGEVEIDERSDTFICFITFETPRLTLVGDVDLSPSPCNQEEEATLRLFVPAHRVEELEERLARIRAVRLPSQELDSPFVLVFPPLDEREVTVFRTIGRRKKAAPGRAGRALSNTFGYREPVDAYLLVESEIQRFLAIVREEGSTSGGFIGPITDPVPIFLDR